MKAPDLGSEEEIKMNKTQHDAKSQQTQADGNTYAYRRFGKEGGIPLVFLTHFRGTMDTWDPALIDRLAESRTIILFDSAGIGESPGDVPDNIEGMADHAMAFLRALDLQMFDLLGFSMGGYVAQLVALRDVDRVRRLVLAGTGPGDGLQRADARVKDVAGVPVIQEKHMAFLFFPEGDSGREAGQAYWSRLGTREGGRTPMLQGKGVGQQALALRRWNEAGGGSLAQLAQLTLPVLVANGREDVMISIESSILMAQSLPDAQLVIFPHAGHGFLFQYAEIFAAYLGIFLDADSVALA